MGLILTLILKMAKKKAKKLVSMKMGIQNMNLISKMAKKKAKKFCSMKVDPRKLNFSYKMTKEKAKQLVSIKMGIQNMNASIHPISLRENTFFIMMMAQSYRENIIKMVIFSKLITIIDFLIIFKLISC